MVYIWKDAGGNIKSYGESPFVLNGSETQTEFEGSMSDYAGRFRLTADKLQIVADDVDEALVTLHCNTGAASVDVWVNGATVNVSLTDGTGQLPAISSDVADSIVIRPVDLTQFCAAGEGSLVIVAVEDGE